MAKTLAALKKLKTKEVFSRAQALEVGISFSTLERLSRAGEVIRVGRGLYGFLASTDEELIETDFKAACAKFGDSSFITGPSALHYYDLIDFAPPHVWLTVPYKVHTTEKRYQLLHSGSDLSFGVEDKAGFRIASIERAIIDTIKHLRAGGDRLGVQGAATALRRTLTTQERLLNFASQLSTSRRVLRTLELLTAEAFGVQ